MKLKTYILIGLLMLVSSCGNGSDVTGYSVVQVESEYVCMINNNLYNTPQIPVEVNGLTYYGCCMGCKAKLENDPSSRVAIDPVSKNSVDKATAVTGADFEGNVYYFESLENLQAYGN